MTSNCPRLVADLIPAILEAHDHWWPRDLQRLALISTEWVGPVRRLQYAHPRLDSFQSCNKLARTLKNNPHLIHLVRALDLRPWYGRCDRALTAKEVASIRFLLDLPELTSVTLGGQAAVAADKFLRGMKSTQALTELHVDGNMPTWDSHCSLQRDVPRTLHWDETVALRFPNLRNLRLSNLELSIDTPATTPSLHLTDLALNNITITHGSLHHLCPASWDTLGHLSIVADNADDWDEHIRFMLDKSTDNLKAFSYEVPDSRMNHNIFHDELLPLVSLRELHLGGISVDNVTLGSLERQCQNLEHLSICGRIVSVTCQEWIRFIQSGALPLLRQLTVPYGYGSRSAEEGTITRRLMEVCVARGIRISPPSFLWTSFM